MTEISFIHSPLWLILAALIAGLVVYLFYFKSFRYSPKQKLLLGALRFLSLLLLAIIALRPILIYSTWEKQKPVLIWLEDASNSIVKLDSLENFQYDIDKVKENLIENFDLRSYAFSDRLYIDSVQFRGISNLDRSLRELRALYYNQKVAAVVLESDGILNRGNALNTLNFDLSDKLFTLKRGRNIQGKNIEIRDLRYNSEVLLGRKLQLEYDLSALNLDNQNIEISLKSEQGELLYQSRSRIDQKNWYESGVIEIEANSKGFKTYVFSISTENGKEATKSFGFRVVEDKVEVIIYSPETHPDISALARALSQDPLVQVQYCRNLNDLGSKQADFIISTDSDISFLNLIEANSWPYLLLLSSEDESPFIKTLYGKSDLELEKQFADWSTGFSLFPITLEQEQIWRDYPPLDGIYGSSQIPSSARPLFSKRIDQLATTETLAFLDDESYGVRGAVILGRGLWRWRMQNYRIARNFEAFDQWVASISQYLLADEKKSPLQVIWDQEIIEGLSTKIQAKLYDKSSNLINDKDLDLVISKNGNKSYQYRLSPYRNIYQLRINELQAGVYRYKATVELDGKKVEQEGSVEVKPNDLESRNLQANHGALDYIASKYKGASFEVNQLFELQQRLNGEEFSGVLIEERNKKEILSRWPLFFVILGLLALEWFLRKYWGQY